MYTYMSSAKKLHGNMVNNCLINRPEYIKSLFKSAACDFIGEMRYYNQ